MYFSPTYISSLIVEPLRFFFANFVSSDLTWDLDPKVSNIEIDTINNFNKIAIQAKPRILVSRGACTVKPIGLSDNLAEPIPTKYKGDTNEIKFLVAYGQAQVLIEAANEGTCERVLELTENFLAWSSSLICNSQGFKQFALPMSVSPCTPSKEDIEIFQCSIGLPWIKETQFQILEDNMNLTGFLISTEKINRPI